MAAALIPESALSAIVGKLVNTASSYVQQDEASGGMADEVAGLQQALPKMELILMALEGTQIADRHKEVETWLWRLRDAVEGAEDVLDELDYYELEKKIQARDRHKVSVPVSRRKRKYADFVKRMFSDDTLKSLMEAVKELNKVAAGMQRIIQIVDDSYGSGFTLQNRYDVTKARETRSCLIENDLEESDYMMLFNKHAYPCVDPDEHEDLKLIGKQITSKLRGMPSAARVVGRVLSSRMDYGYWERILNHIMNLEQSEGDLTVLSEWDHLPTHLQMCFRYCSLFPQGYMFEKDKLISMWMASGLIQQPMHEKKRPEDIGADYLNILSRKSFFNRKLRGPGENFVYYYFMHDLLYELAQNTSSGECLQIKGVGQKNIPSTLRHLTLESATPLEIRMISHLKHLRTLIVSYTDFCNPEGDHVCALNEVLKGLKSLRLFSLNVYIFRKLPDPIGSLIHLRYLSLRQQCSNKNLLDFVSHPVYGPSLRRVLDWFAQSARRLYHLEVMETSEFPEVNFDKTELDGLDNLINLRHLYFPSDITIRIPWIGKLTSLQELNDFNVREESGYRITELKDLKELRQLYVGNLQNASHEEAVEAKLSTKANLKSLTLEWSVGRSTVSETDELFLDNLQPYCNLTELKLDGYNGASFSNWINSEFLPNLKSVVLFNCHKLENLPLEQLNSLHFLHLNSMRAVKTIRLSMYGCNAGVLQLRELRFECMPEWVEWDLVEGRSSFPELQILEIKDCPRLRRLPTLPPNLRGLSITNAGLDDFPRIHSFVDPKEVGLSSPPVAHPFPISDYSSITNCRVG